MREFNAVVAHLEGGAVAGRLEALEGGRGLMRVVLEPARPPGVELGCEWVLEMHDGARFRVRAQERLPGEGEWRVQLLGRV